MLTIVLLVVVALAAVIAVASPILKYARRPWLFDAPSAEEETLRQEQIMALDSLRDLAMDYRMGQLSEADYRSLAAPLQKRAKQTLEQQMGEDAPLDLTADSGVVADLDADLEAAILALRNVGVPKEPPSTATLSTPDPAKSIRFCTQCGEKANKSHRFCAACGASLPQLAIAEEEMSSRDSQQNDNTSDAVSLSAAETTAATTKADSASSILGDDAHSYQSSVGNNEHLRANTTPHMDLPTKTSSMRRWWIASGLFTAIWIVAITWIYLNGRAGQESQTPVTTFPEGAVSTVASTTGRTLVSSKSGLHVSTDIQTWSQLSTEDTIFSLTPLGTDSAWIGVGAQGVWHADANGESWEFVASQPADIGIRQVAYSTSGLLWGANEDALYLSEDEGATWTLINDAIPGSLRSLAVGPSDLFIGTDRGVFRSPDDGISWIDSNSVVNGRIGSTNVQAVAYDEQGNNVFAGTPQGIYFLNLDSMGGWGRRSLDANVSALAIPAGANNVLWAGTANGEIFHSTDRGVTWQN